MSESLGSSYFEGVYAASGDPWNFETSPYEAAKYADTLSALTHARYGNAFEVGCSIGVLTRKLADRCDALLATDVSHKALEAAKKRCAGLNHVTFQQMSVPSEFPDGLFDLIVVSEVAYYWNREDLVLAAGLMRSRLMERGNLLLVHFTPVVSDYPLTGDEVHEYFLSRPDFLRVQGHAADQYRLDLLEAKS